MSQELAIIKGRTEIVDRNTKSVHYKNSELYVTSFAGPDGPMIQLSPGLLDNHIQLNKEEVKKLIKTLNDWL